MEFIDTHTHLESFARRGELRPVLDRALAAGVGRMIAIGTSTDDWTLYRELAEAHPGVVFYTAGLHPCAVTSDWREQLAAMERCWTETPSRTRPVAIGETGLDRFHLPKDNKDEAARIFTMQREAFAESLRCAKRLDVPVVVHSRGAFEECVDLVDASGVGWEKVIFHCFVEGPAEMNELTRRGGWGSFTGVLTYKSADNVRSALKAQGLSRLMLETDAPYLTPFPHRGKPNEPAYLVHIASIAAQTLEVPLGDVARTTSETACRVFGLPA